MCGIIGIVSQENIAPALLKALKRLEYRGYDSAGLAVFVQNEVIRYRSVGMLKELHKKIPPALSASTGMGHTRWATHGTPCEINAHPHMSESVSIVHNGIIENFDFFKRMLLAEGYEFESETDTEVMAHLLDHTYKKYKDWTKVFQEVLPLLEGSFAIACMLSSHPHQIIAARKGTSPLVIGYGDKGHAISSDVLGLIDLSHTLTYLPDESWAFIKSDGVEVYDFKGQALTLEKQPNPFISFDLNRGQYNHYMLKEIHEQSHIIQNLQNQPYPDLTMLGNGRIPAHITLLGCGTSFYAGWIGKYYLEHLCPITLELASEFHYRHIPMVEGITIAISQSGETADTLKAAQYAKSCGQKLVALVNFAHSSLARIADWTLDTQAGPEIGVASTKSFLAQLWVLLHLSGFTKTHTLAHCMEQTLLLIPSIQDIAKKLVHAQSILYLGRGMSYPLALEGALKMKELAYIHAEGMAAGELKHGSIALIDPQLLVIMLAPFDSVFEKTLSNTYEVAARNGNILVLTDEKGATSLRLPSIRDLLILPFMEDERLNPFIYGLVLQLLAYYTALYRNCAIDKPRNLAKSVTVE